MIYVFVSALLGFYPGPVQFFSSCLVYILLYHDIKDIVLLCVYYDL